MTHDAKCSRRPPSLRLRRPELRQEIDHRQQSTTTNQKKKIQPEKRKSVPRLYAYSPAELLPHSLTAPPSRPPPLTFPYSLLAVTVYTVCLLIPPNLGNLARLERLLMVAIYYPLYDSPFSLLLFVYQLSAAKPCLARISNQSEFL